MRNSIADLRKARGDLTQEGLGLAVGVTRQTINAIETGKYNPLLPLAFRIAKFFGLLIEEVFEYEEEVAHADAS